MTEISGAVGYTLLKHTDLPNKIFLFSDIHAEVSYCTDPNSKEIHELLDESVEKDIEVFLEEGLREESVHLESLWDAPHTEALRKLNLTNLKIVPVDIRSLLIPFSWELCEESEYNCNMTLRTYLTDLDELFNFRPCRCMIKYILPNIKMGLGNLRTRKMLIVHFYILKKIFSKYIIKKRKYWNYSIRELVKDHCDILEKINTILSMIMEWYILLLINNCQSNLIIHIGLAHASNILEYLSSIYGYSIIRQIGINKMSDLSGVTTTQVSACVKGPDIDKGLFNKKYHFN